MQITLLLLVNFYCTCISTGISPRTLCLRPKDVDECVLGLHNCSTVAECTDLANGFTCACPAGYVDGNTALPGRVCAALLCDLCNGHGDCVPQADRVVCSCVDGYQGEYCEKLPSPVPFVLLVLLALAFLFLTLW